MANNTIGLYIADVTIEPAEETMPREVAFQNFVRDVQGYEGALLADPIGLYAVRVVIKKYGEKEMPSNLSKIPLEQPITRILKTRYGIQPSMRRLLTGAANYIWIDGDVDEAELPRIQNILNDIPNVGPSFVSGRENTSLYIKGFGVGERGMEELRYNLTQIPISNPSVFVVVGSSIKETEEINNELIHLLYQRA